MSMTYPDGEGVGSRKSSDAFKIDKVGFYRQRDGGKAEVLGIRGEWSYGINMSGHAKRWYLDGLNKTCGNCDYDLVAPWTDPPKPTPAGVWYGKNTETFYYANGQWAGHDFHGKWFPRRDEFPQGQPATPWRQEDVPFPALFRDNKQAPWIPAWITGEGLRLANFGLVDYPALAKTYQWSPDNVRWFPCTREAVAAWRNGVAK